MNHSLDTIGRLTLDKAIKLNPYVPRSSVQREAMTDDELMQLAGDTLVIDSECYHNYFLIAFKHLKTGKIIPYPELDEQFAVILEHYDDMLAHYGNDLGVRMARKHIGWYTSGLINSAEFRHSFNQISDANQAKELLHQFYKPFLH